MSSCSSEGASPRSHKRAIIIAIAVAVLCLAVAVAGYVRSTPTIRSADDVDYAVPVSWETSIESVSVQFSGNVLVGKERFGKRGVKAVLSCRFETSDATHSEVWLELLQGNQDGSFFWSAASDDKTVQCLEGNEPSTNPRSYLVYAEFNTGRSGQVSSGTIEMETSYDADLLDNFDAASAPKQLDTPSLLLSVFTSYCDVEKSGSASSYTLLARGDAPALTED